MYYYSYKYTKIIELFHNDNKQSIKIFLRNRENFCLEGIRLCRLKKENK